MATIRPSRWGDTSPVYLAGLQAARDDLSAKLQAAHSTTQGSRSPLLSLFQELEQDSREFPHNSHGLMIAILAGERVLQEATESEIREAQRVTAPLLTNLLVRRSKWDSLTRRPDLERAIQLAKQWLDLEEGASKLNALRKIAELYEKRFKVSANESDLQEAILFLEGAGAAALRDQNTEIEALLTDAACLRFKRDPRALRCILEIPIEQLSKQAVTWTSVSREKFRFIDAQSLAAGNSLRVLELDILPKQRYIALSYVWRGSQLTSSDALSMGTMTIDGALGADPISIKVLISVCKCVATLNCELLWIDGVCIIQNDEVDKSWQIQNMFHIYKHCQRCLVLPGGLSRLVPLTEPTSWIHRAWTLQEALAPDSCTVLFAWAFGDCDLQTHFPVRIREVEPGQTGQADLRSLLMIHPSRSPRILKYPDFDLNKPVGEVKVTLLCTETELAQRVALLGAIDNRGREGMGNAIWRASLMRIALHPADTVFSIMGLMGVTLNPLQFDANDRTGPTIALMQALLRKGERAEWLGAAPEMQINERIPTLPKFPNISAKGTAFMETEVGGIPISQAMGDTWWRLLGAPKGTMQADGTLLLRAPIIPIRKERTGSAGVPLKAPGFMRQDTAWYPCPQCVGPPFAIQLGKKERYDNGARPRMVDTEPFLLMLVDEVSSGLVRNIGYATMSRETEQIAGWSTRDIAIAREQVFARREG